MSHQGAVIYIRVSDEKQAQTDTGGGYSLPHQRDACQEKAHEVGAAFTEIFEEPGNTATVRNRPAFKRALERAKQGDVSWFIVHKASRLARNARDALNIEFELAESGVKLVAVTEAWDDTPMGKLMKLMQFGFDQVYSERLSEDVRSKMAEKVKRGGTPHIAPQGYLNVRKNIDGIANVARVEIDEDRAHHITWAFKAYATGNYSIRSLMAELTDRGFTLRATRRYPERPVTRSTLATILRNPYYLGIVTWNGEQYTGEQSHPALIDVPTFEKVQQVLAGNNTGGDKSWRYKRYLKGTLWCGYCKSRLGFMHGRGEGGEYEYFYCLGRQEKNGCPQRYIPVATAEALVERHYARVQEHINEQLPALQDAFRELLGTFQDQVEAEVRRLKGRLTQLEREQRKLLDLAYGDRLSPNVVQEELSRIAKQTKQTEQALHVANIDIGDLQTRFDQFCTLLSDIQTTYLHAPDEYRRSINQFVFASLDIKDEEITEHDLAELTGYVLDEELPEQMRSQTVRFARQANDANWESLVTSLQNEELATRSVTSSNMTLVVDRTGLEPVTSRV